MFLPPGKAMRLRRDIAFAVICLRRDICPSDKLWIKNFHSVQRTLSLRSINRGPRGTQCGKANKNGRRDASVLCDITIICGCR